MSTRIDELLRDVSAKRLRKHKAAKKELLILADNLENVALIVKGGTLATAVLFMAQSKDYYRYIGVEILIRLCATGEHWAQIAPQRDFFYHTITDMVESYVDEDLSDNPALQNHIRSRVEVMRSTAARLKKLKLRNASSLGDDSGSGSAEGKVVSASDNSVAGPSSSRRRKTRTRSGNYSATRTASRSSTPPIDDDDSAHNDAVDSPRREASKRAARAKLVSSDDTALLATLPPPPLPADEPPATTTTTSTTATVANNNNNDHATPDPPSQPFVPPPPPTPPVAHEHDPEAPDEHAALYHTRSTPARVGSPAPPLPPASSLRETQSSRSMQNRSPPPLPPAYTRDNQHRSSGGLRRHKQRPKSSAPDRPTMAAPTPGDATRPVISDAQRAKELADDLELLKKLKIQMMVAAGAVGSARKALDKQNTPQNQALLKHAQTRTSQLSAQISELTAKTNSATATPIAQSSHRPAPGSVQLTSTSSAHAVRLVRSMSIDGGNRVTDIKTSEEKGREARLLAMFDIAAATTVTSADQLAPPPPSSSSAVAAADETQSGTAASPSVAGGGSSSTRDALHATPERRRSSLAHGETANDGDDADTDEQDAAQREAAAADAEERRRTKRALAAREILDTEQRYVACLGSLVDNYKAALDESLATHLKQRKPGPGRGPQPIATAAQIKTMFSNVQAILNTNRVLLAQLRQRVEAWDDATSQLGDVFLRLSDFFKIYIEYANNYDAAQDVLDALLNDSEAFLRFCEAMELVDQLDLGLEDLLIMPVQRLPRYTMLLETLLKYTPKDHADFEHLTQAVAKLADVAQQINDTNREVEQRRKVFEVQQSLDMPENAPPLVAPHRLLECDASCRFVVQENENTRLKAAHVYVFNDLVALAMIPPNPKQQRPQLFCTISLRTGRTARLADQKTGKRGDDIQNALVLIDLARTGQYVLCLGTPAERDQLLEIIEDSKSMTIHRLISRDLVEDRT